MTKMAVTPIYGKNPLNLLPQNQKDIDLETWYVALGMCSSDDPRLTLTYFTSRSNLLPKGPVTQGHIAPMYTDV